jgi:hypothetical protein
MAIGKVTDASRVKALIMDYETTIYNKLIRSLNAERRDGDDESDMRHLIRHAQLLHEGMRRWYQQSLGIDPSQSLSSPGTGISLVDGEREIATLPVVSQADAPELHPHTERTAEMRPEFLAPPRRGETPSRLQG